MGPAEEITKPDLGAAIDSLSVTVLRMMRERNEFERRLDEILNLIDGREDIDDNGGPNIFMRIAMTARGEDRP